MKLEWGENRESFDYPTAWNDAHNLKDKGWRLPSPQELMDAASSKVPGFTDGKYYWTNDWNGDPSHAGAVEMYGGGYFIGMPLENRINYRLVKEI
jgi:hypothetical protein